jgi:conjugal transfer pilin signal peptidase TrbI
VGDFLRHARQRWYLYLPIVAIWSLAYVRLFIDATPRVPSPFQLDAEPALSRCLAAARLSHRLQRGDFIVFSFAGEAQQALSGITRSAFLQDRARFTGRHRNRQPAGK